MPVETGGNNVVWADIENLCTFDPVTGQWSGDPVAISNDLDNDYRHVTGTTYDAVYRLLFNVAEAMGRASQNADWEGVWVDRINGFATGGQKQQVAFQVWKKIRAQPNTSPEYIPIGDADFGYPPQSASVTDRFQKGGLGFEEFDKLLQDIVEVPDPAYTGDLTTAQEVRDLWVLLTGGRKFGATQTATIQGLIDTQNASEARYSTQQVTIECRDRAQVAIDAVDAAYQANKTDVQARADYENAWAAVVPPPLPYIRPEAT